ncbi:MAG: NnrU family protein [Methylococcaceae bacterium]
MTQLILAALFFITLHIGVSGTSARGRAIEKLGENVYRAAFSLLSLLGIVWLAHAYRVAGYIETWGQLVWFKPIAALLMLVAFLLVVLGIMTPNPMAVGGENLLMADAPARGIHRVTRHPFLWGVAVWAFVHMIANGDAASLVLFGSLLVLVFAGMISIDAKRKKTCGRHWDSYAAATSIIPFQAIKEGRNTLVIAEFKVWQLVVALVLYLVVMHFHQSWFGVSPLF